MQLSQIKDNEWAPCASMRSHICLTADTVPAGLRRRLIGRVDRKVSPGGGVSECPFEGWPWCVDQNSGA